MLCFQAAFQLLSPRVTKVCLGDAQGVRRVPRRGKEHSWGPWPGRGGGGGKGRHVLQACAQLQWGESRAVRSLMVAMWPECGGKGGVWVVGKFG